MKQELICKKDLDIRFSDVDCLGMVWHGNYIKYIEDGREAFGKKFGLQYWDIHEQGFVTPIVKLNIDYKKSLRLGDNAIIVTKFIDSEAAKIIFEYTILKVPDNIVIATAESVQVFLTNKGDLHLTIPDFFIEWKKQWNLI